jgi:hypothetical protein
MHFQRFNYSAVLIAATAVTLLPGCVTSAPVPGNP